MQDEIRGLLRVLVRNASAAVEHGREIVDPGRVALGGSLFVEGHRGDVVALHAPALLVHETEVDHARGAAEIGRPLVPRRRLDRVGRHAVPGVVQQGQIQHRRHVAGLGALREQAHRLGCILGGDLAVDENDAEAVHRLVVVLVRGLPQQAQTLLLVLGDTAAFNHHHRKGRLCTRVAGGRALAVPGHGLRVVARHADAGCVHPPQTKHDVGISAIRQPAQRLQEIAAVGGDAPHFQLRVRARHHRLHPLAQLVHMRDGTAVESNDDIAEA